MSKFAYRFEAPRGRFALALDRESMHRVIALWLHYFRPRALAVFHQVGRADRDCNARRMVRWRQRSGRAGRRGAGQSIRG